MTSLRIDPDTLDFVLPEDRIAQVPSEKRDQARLMVLNRGTNEIEHRVFADITDYLKRGDVLVINKAQVDPAKILAKKSTGGRIEVIFLKQIEGNEWLALVRPFLKTGAEIILDSGEKATVKSRQESGEYVLSCGFDPKPILTQRGRLPLPPYIKRDVDDKRHELDKAMYQTVFASAPGSIAAPTAGLHFTPELLERVQEKGVEIIDLVLNVGWGTFKPVAESVSTHVMLPETFEMSSEQRAKLESARREGRRIVAVGTTSTRALESMAAGIEGQTNLFIRPGYEFKVVNSLVTNFHVPRSTPVSLAAAFSGFPLLEKAYAQAIEENYAFFSYGDAMLIL